MIAAAARARGASHGGGVLQTPLPVTLVASAASGFVGCARFQFNKLHLGRSRRLSTPSETKTQFCETLQDMLQAPMQSDTLCGSAVLFKVLHPVVASRSSAHVGVQTTALQLKV